MTDMLKTGNGGHQGRPISGWLLTVLLIKGKKRLNVVKTVVLFTVTSANFRGPTL